MRSNAVAPGWLPTPWVDKYVPEAQQGRVFAEHTPTGGRGGRAAAVVVSD